MMNVKMLLTTLATFVCCIGMAQMKKTNATPPNGFATVTLSGKHLTIRYDGEEIFYGDINLDAKDFYIREAKDNEAGKISHSISITSRKQQSIKLNGTIAASGQSFPCEENRGWGSSLVRHSVGLSHSLLNKAVYDRKKDWALSVEQANVVITPSVAASTGNKFNVVITGDEIVFLFKPHYYQHHRGLSYFEPWKYDVWQKPVVGWSSWYAYFSKVNEKNVHDITDVLSNKLKKYGLEYIQIDDGYQQETAEPAKWTTPNDKFPSGMDGLADYITNKGLKPAIWTNVAFTNKSYVDNHKSFFLKDAKGEPVTGRWVGYVMDGSNTIAMDSLVKPIYKYFKQTGWKYYKLDALRHLRYEGYNSNNNYFTAKKTSGTEAFRNVVKAVRSEIGKDNFLLACWGIRPELVGIVDGCRIGNDGYGIQSLTQYNSFNNVIWRNDPDHIELSEKVAYPACMATSMTGSLFLLTDKPEKYQTPIIDAAIRSIPVMHTVPGQLYDIDPSCSMYLDRLNSTVSGSMERVFDARYKSPYDLFLLEMNKVYESWMLLGRTGKSQSSISFAEMGLDKNKQYLVFEFWTKSFKGVFKEGFQFGDMDTTYNCQLFTVREDQHHPQLVATNRHISSGGLEIDKLDWNNNALNGQSQLVADDQYIIYIYEPEGFSFKDFKCPEAVVVNNQKRGNIRSITIQSNTAKAVEWTVSY
ncbi:glycoside hydrolase family 36 protein [Pinibacter aurantiacus]|uniref:Alpha-galactosidase n=1 Tax=Pinibacter aurantiacus TaxID=2851599 RepID=A0A9E2SGU3_9BACT|nr:glycoside hydrolase family 36 protein [Pinibacter aurantiacus]MBV4360580.1 alpha-galactosidase [Pinibacter aurantiacus]